MKRLAWVPLVALLGAAASAEEQQLAAWRLRMEKVSATMSALMPDLVSDARFSDAKARARLVGQVRSLRELAHDMSRDTSPATRDPSVGMMTTVLRDQLADAEDALKAGHAPYARAVLYGVVNTCIGCHARTDVGARFGTMTLSPAEAKLSAFDATLHAATRRYDDAFREYSEVLADPMGPVQRGLEWDRSLQAALTLAVRALDDPKRARDVADAVVAHPAAPLFLKQTALAWRASIDAWSVEPKPVAALTDDELFTKANALLDEALMGARRHPRRSQAVQYLRASRLLHDVLGRSPGTPRAQEALHLLGLAYEGLAELELFELHPMMFEACIRRQPHTPTAALCLERYESALYLQFSGSGGYDLPADMKAHLSELRKLGQ